MTKHNQIIRIQADRLAESIGLTPGIKFELSELDALAATDIGLQQTTFRGKKVPFSPSIKSLADILRKKIRKEKI